MAFQNTRPGQSHHKAVILAWLSLAYLGLAWPGSRPQARPCTALYEIPHSEGRSGSDQGDASEPDLVPDEIKSSALSDGESGGGEE